METDPVVPVCAKCGKRPGTNIFSQDTMSFVHGFSEPRCDICLWETQQENGRGIAGALPDIEAKLAAALATEATEKPS
jgi:hypothetical protein